MYAVAQRTAQTVPLQELLLGALDRAQAHHPVLTLTAAMVFMGVGMLLAVMSATAICVLPIALFMGWI